MSNPLFNQLGGKITQNPFQQILADAQILKNKILNPRQEVERLLRSGQMSNEQFNYYSQMASQILASKK